MEYLRADGSESTFDIGLELGLGVQSAADKIYLDLNSLLNKYFPAKFVTVTSHDPPYVTPGSETLVTEEEQSYAQGQDRSSRLDFEANC